MHHISTIYARFICRELGLTATSAEPLLADATVDFDQINGEAFMPYQDFFAFLRRIRAFTPDPLLGLKVGQKLAPASLGELGHAILSAPSLAQALQLPTAFVQIHAGYFRLDLIPTQTGSKLVFVELVDLADTRQFQTEVMLMMSQNLIEAVTGKPLAKGRICFPYAAPDNAEQYPHYFNSQCEFNATHATLEIPKADLEIASPFYDAIAWDSYQLKLSQQLNKLQQTSNHPYSDHVRRFLSAQPPPLPDVTATAQSLNISERTLNRHLSREGNNFRELRNLALKDYAEFYLRESDLTIDAIAAQLGYQDFSSFRRAFKLWHGCTPGEFRLRNQ
ncbi:AraC family transcriptional regulator ligand-binding domain-containing protein [Bacterioplanoides sp.]|uniref:AraC family transcriptional regulator n=1 Tax=Bacterioplanoides sp. TaxID=2066072 RepID=UPI003B59E601